MATQALVAVVRAEAELLATRLPHLARDERAQARQVLWVAWQALDAPRPKRQVLGSVAHALVPWRQADAIASAWTLRKLRPHPTFIRRTLVGDPASGWANHLTHRWQPRLALSPTRLAWWEARLTGEVPVHAASIRTPEKQDRQALELLHKRGRSRFS